MIVHVYVPTFRTGRANLLVRKALPPLYEYAGKITHETARSRVTLARTNWVPPMRAPQSAAGAAERRWGFSPGRAASSLQGSELGAFDRAVA